MADGTPGRALGALRHRNYRLFFTGQIVSTVGTWMQSVAMPWLALELTHSGFLVGLVLAAQFTPILIGGQFGGIVADRFHKRNVLLATQTAFMVPPFVLYLLTASGHAQYWMVIGAALAAGIINVFDVPARQAFVVEMVGKQDLTNAIALNSSVFNGAAVIGPSIAGVVIAFVGVPLCFLSNSISYVAAIAALLLMRNLPRREPMVHQERFFARLAEGAGYARRTPVVAGLLLTVAFFSLFAMNRSTLLPLFADEVLHVGAQGFGFMLAAMGLGAVCGALTLAFFPEMGANPRRQLWVAAIWCAALLEFSLCRVFVISLVTLFVAGYCQISFLATTNSRLQTVTPDHLRGRVMALYMQAFAGMSPIGNVQAGLLASLWGAPWSMGIGAIIAAATLVGIALAVPDVFGAERAEAAPTDSATRWLRS